jgi:hypothetical protein
VYNILGVLVVDEYGRCYQTLTLSLQLVDKDFLFLSSGSPSKDKWCSDGLMVGGTRSPEVSYECFQVGDGGMDFRCN